MAAATLLLLPLRKLAPIAQAVAAAAQQLQHTHEGELDSKRLAEAMHLVLSHSVTLNLDGSSTVQSGKRVYSQQGDACACPDHQHRQSFCKHLQAVELYRLAQGLLRSEPASKAPVLPAPPAPASAAWDVHEAPVSCYLKFRVGHLELSYTMRDVDDNHLASRLTHVLPKVNAMAEAEEARRQQLAAEQASPAEAGSGSQPPAMPPEPEEQVNDDGDKWCAMHQDWMPERSNDKGSWHSHQASDEQGEYYCKGNGRPRRNRR
jgi:hypothetical protein